MHGWFQKFKKSRASSSAPRGDHEAKVTKQSASSLSSSCSSTSSLTSQGTATSKSTEPLSALSTLRWTRKYDVFVCHSSVQSDTEEAIRLVSFLEDPPRNLRCFLMQRDACPGGAIPTELCQALQNSHVKALLITPNFLQDDWCMYMMHQVLAEGPMTNRIIPLIQNLSRSQYPQELKFYFYIDLSKNIDWGFALVNKTVLQYLDNLVKNEKTFSCNTDSSSNEPSEEHSPKTI